MRLVGGDAHINSVLDNLGDVRGLINVCENEQWSHICDADWTMEDASVACRELGYAQPGWFFLYNYYNYIFIIQVIIMPHAASFGTNIQYASNVPSLSYRPECSGHEDSLSACTHAQLTSGSEQCAIAAVGCWNSSTDSVQPTHTAAATDTLAIPSSSSSGSSTTTMSFTSSSHNVHRSSSFQSSSRTIATTNSQVPKRTSSSSSVITSTPPLLTATSSKVPSGDEASTQPIPHLILYAAVAAALILVLALAILVVLVCLCCRRRSLKQPRVEDHTYETPVIKHKNEMFHEIDQKELPETEILYEKVVDPRHPELGAVDQQTYHTLNHSPASTSKNSRGSTELPLNEVLYEKVIPVASRSTLPRYPPQQRPPVYHTLENPSEKNGTPHYHVLERSTSTGRVGATDDAGRRKAATLPAGLTLPAREQHRQGDQQQHRGSVTLL